MNILLCLLFIVDLCVGNLPFDLQLSQADITQNGIAFPNTIDVVKGHDVMVKLLKTIRNQERCILRTPNFTMVDIAHKNDRIELWSDACGIKIKNVQHADGGMWRLISEDRNEKLEGLFSLFVREITLNINENVEITSNETEEKTFINFGNKNTYCFLTREAETQNSFIHGNCSLPVDKVTKHLEGLWNVKMGLKGNIDEEQSQTMVKVVVEEVDVGYSDDINKNIVNMYCNLKNYEHFLDFCRFERVSDAKGFHLSEGIGKDRYSYFGQGLVKNQCGITIKQPIQEDYGVWRCSIGFRIDHNTTKNFDRILTLHKPAKTYTNNNVKTILSPIGKQLDIICDAKVSIIYCSVTHPNGTEFTAISSDNKDELMPYRYDDSEFGNGKCKFIFNKGSYEDSGLWTCHIGQSYPFGIEEKNTIQVKVVGEITALEPILKVHLGKPMNISCAATEKSRSLKYCRFSPPNGPRFPIDERIKFNNAILQQYYFKDGCKLWKGDCAITIKKVSHEHLGKWTCSAMTDENNTEHSDNIILEISREQLSAASVVGLIFGIVLSVIIVTGLGYFVWRRRRYNPMNTEIASPEPAPGRPPRQEVSVQYEARPSGSSDSSETQLAFVPDIHKQTTYGASTSTPLS